MLHLRFSSISKGRWGAGREGGKVRRREGGREGEEKGGRERGGYGEREGGRGREREGERERKGTNKLNTHHFVYIKYCIFSFVYK